MGTSGGTTGLVVGGGSVSSGIATPLPHTLLSPNRYAKIMGITPAHFNGLASATIFPLTNRCSDVWLRYDWQSADSVSLESLAQAIAEAEANIKSYIRYSVAPDWEVKDVRPWPKYYRREAYVLMDGPIDTTYNYVISPGQRAVTLIDDNVAVAYSDPDGDGYNELATITAATSITDIREIKVYIAGNLGAREWEIRPIRSISIAGGIVTITFNSWILVNPDKRELPPTSEGVEALDLLDAANYLSTVDVYREYTDATAISSETQWSSGCLICGGVGCSLCSIVTKTGCSKVISTKPGLMQVLPATYTNGQWNVEVWPTGAEPTQVLLWYLAGFQSTEYLAG